MLEEVSRHPDGRPLRVALLAPPALCVPPDGYGGTEYVIHGLACALARQGCDVRVLAAGDLAETFAAPVGLDLPRAEATGCELAHTAMAWRQVRPPGARKAGPARDPAADPARPVEADLIHDHTKAAGVLLAPWAAVPVLTTVHNDWTPARGRIYGAHPSHPFVFLSRAHAQRFPDLVPFGIVPNGVDVAGVPFRAQNRGDYVLFLGRFARVKGPAEAIAAAREAGVPIVLAGRVDPSDPCCFQEDVAPLLDGKQVRLAGEVGGSRKWALLCRARALVAPFRWEEPFGLTLVEAMACGTPVVAFRRGAAPEIVQHGVTGYLADDQAGLVAGIRAAQGIDPYVCRQHVASRFSADAMARAYLALYARLLDRGAGTAREAAGARGSGREDPKGGKE